MFISQSTRRLRCPLNFVSSLAPSSARVPKDSSKLQASIVASRRFPVISKHRMAFVFPLSPSPMCTHVYNFVLAKGRGARLKIDRVCSRWGDSKGVDPVNRVSLTFSLNSNLHFATNYRESIVPSRSRINVRRRSSESASVEIRIDFYRFAFYRWNSGSSRKRGAFNSCIALKISS